MNVDKLVKLYSPDKPQEYCQLITKTLLEEVEGVIENAEFSLRFDENGNATLIRLLDAVDLQYQELCTRLIEKMCIMNPLAFQELAYRKIPRSQQIWHSKKIDEVIEEMSKEDDAPNSGLN